MDTYPLIFLRIVHIFAGTLWIGAGVFYLFFIKPSVKAIGAAGPQFMQNLAERRKYPMFMLTISLLTVIAGGLLYWYDAGGFSLTWIQTGPGLGFTIGALAALVAFFVGSLGIGPTSAKMGALGQQIGRSGGRPSQEQISQMEAMEKRLVRFEQIDFVMLTISLIAMATARYWNF